MTVDRHTQATAEIHALIEAWAASVRNLDIAGVMADHAEGMLMFDVPPPVQVRGLDAYRETWGPFFDWLKTGGVFEIVALDITAGEDVAYATALLRCDLNEKVAAHPEPRLRLTLGLRRESGRWMIAHEHHSYPLSE